MKKSQLLFLFVLTFFASLTVAAPTVEEITRNATLRYGSTTAYVGTPAGDAIYAEHLAECELEYIQCQILHMANEAYHDVVHRWVCNHYPTDPTITLNEITGEGSSTRKCHYTRTYCPVQTIGSVTWSPPNLTPFCIEGCPVIQTSDSQCTGTAAEGGTCTATFDQTEGTCNSSDDPTTPGGGAGGGGGGDGGDGGGDGDGGDGGSGGGDGGDGGDGGSTGGGGGDGDGDGSGDGGDGGDGGSSGGGDGGGSGDGGEGDGDGSGDGGDGGGDGSGDGSGDGDGDGDNNGGGGGGGGDGGGGDGAGGGDGDGDGDGSGDGDGDGDGNGECDPETEDCGGCDPETEDCGECDPSEEDCGEADGGNCSKEEKIPPSCDGDPIQCVIQESSWLTQCEQLLWQEDLSGDDDYNDGDSLLDDSELNTLEYYTHEVDGSDTGIDSGLFGGGGGSCPPDRTISVMGGSISFSFSMICEFALMIRPLVIALAYFSAALIYIRGFLGD